MAEKVKFNAVELTKELLGWISPLQIPNFFIIFFCCICAWFSTFAFAGAYWLGAGLPILAIIQVASTLAIRAKPPPTRDSSSDIRFSLVFGVSTAVAFLAVFGFLEVSHPVEFLIIILTCSLQAAVFLWFGFSQVKDEAKHVSFDYLQFSSISATLLGFGAELFRESWAVSGPYGNENGDGFFNVLMTKLFRTKSTNMAVDILLATGIYAVWMFTIAIWVIRLQFGVELSIAKMTGV
jgi:hypothetical protein